MEQWSVACSNVFDGTTQHASIGCSLSSKGTHVAHSPVSMQQWLSFSQLGDAPDYCLDCKCEPKRGCRVLAEALDPFEAVANPRLHHQLVPDQVVTENYTSPFSAENVTIRSPEYVITGTFYLTASQIMKHSIAQQVGVCKVYLGTVGGC